MPHFTLAYSPCPNDTFIFDALIHGLIDTEGYTFEVIHADVEQLNQWAEEGKYDLTKLSYAQYFKVQTHYQLLETGSALGEGVGPLLVSKQAINTSSDTAIKALLSKATIAIPGWHTTAHLLLSGFCPEAHNKQVFVFDEIEHAVLNGIVDVGLLIHEGRFTYAAKGLHLVRDLGDWWEQTYEVPIPLGGIVCKHAMANEHKTTIEKLIRQSIQYAWQRWPSLSDYIENHAQEMDPQVMRQHIELYVNNFSENLGEKGHAAIDAMEAIIQNLNTTDK